ncbi:MAG: UDP-N-acetylenolpyruvoylglucosamine reductase [Parcubacteria group bacterium GW2011_GWB1_40_14]|nr:MAG: UDP-N-acetylenolpyruvoylglucosamine reductase [Parcubacteria group bacterium GW2011_GWB1_40_14]
MYLIVMNITDFKTDVKLAPYTSIGVGGPADYFYEAKTADELKDAVLTAKEKNIPYIIFGGGTNVLVSDDGFRGLVIVARNNNYEINGENIDAGAGIVLGVLLGVSVKAGLQGLEWSAGLPGSLGGAIYGNAGTFGKSIGQFIEEVTVLEPSGDIRKYTPDECGFRYRQSNFQNMPGTVIISAKLKLQQGNVERLKEEIKKNALWRAQNHPPYKSCGCVFRNATFTKEARLPQDENEPVQWFDKVPVGWLIDQAGLKGKKLGGFTVSDVHGNFLINDGTGTAEQLEQLISEIKKDIKDKFNLDLEEEVRRVG